MPDARREARDARDGSEGAKFDDAVDRAVRDMLDVAPPVDLRARVLAEIGRRNASGLRWKWIVAPIAATAVVVLSVVEWLPSRHAPVVAVQSARTGSPPDVVVRTEPSPQVTVIGRPPLASAPRIDGVPVGRPSRVRRVASTNVDTPDDLGVAPLDPIAPIHVAAVTQPDITPQPIAVEPLAPIVQVQIAPLTPPDGRH